MSQKLFQLKDVLPNPFRDIKSYPIREDKIEALTASFERTGYWGNIVGRMKGDKVEIAYGHHRLVAMRKSMKKTDEVAIIVKSISDEDMLRMMADENMQEWGSNSVIEQETIRSVVLAYAAGKIELEKPEAKQRSRYAPSFRKGVESNGSLLSPYNTLSIAKFLSKGVVDKSGGGWLQRKGDGLVASPRVRNALSVLEAAEEMGAKEDFAEMTKGLGTEQAKVVVGAVKDVARAHKVEGASPSVAKKKAIQAGKAVAEEMRKPIGQRKGGTRGAKEIAKDYKPQKKEEIPNVDDVVESFIGEVNDVLRDDVLKKKMDSILELKEYVDERQQKKLIRVLGELSKRCERLMTSLGSKSVGSKVPLLER